MFNMHGDSKRINCTLNNKGKQSTEFKMHFKEINVRTKVTSTIATDRDGKKSHINSIWFLYRSFN